MGIKETDQAYVASTYARFPVELVSGHGSVLKDAQGKEYIDLGSGIAVNTFGVSDAEWEKAVTAQIAALQHTSNLYYTAPCAELAKQLCERTGMKKVFFSNSGAEANECAIKCARRYAFQKYGDESHATIITLKNSFHGRTVTTLSATGQDSFHKEFGPFTQGFVYAEANNPEDLRKKAEENNCCAILFEVVQGEGGVVPLTKAFTDEIQKIAAERELLIMVDEVQTGNGRTGELYGYMHYGLKPDVVTTAKGLAGGLPLGATMLGEKVKNTFDYGSHGSTFGGNPVCCAGALNILGRLDKKLLSEVKEKSAYIISRLQDAEGVAGVSGMGLMLGIETRKEAKEVAAACLKNGVLVLTAKTKVRLLPALNIPFEQLEKAIDILKQILAE